MVTHYFDQEREYSRDWLKAAGANIIADAENPYSDNIKDAYYFLVQKK
jgi:hypothetical protein